MTTMTRSYRELSRLHSFEDRFKYLALRGGVGDPTFGFDRWMNQQFYRSAEWRHIRNEVIVRDEGCDLGIDGYEIHTGLTIHHMNPMTIADIRDSEEMIFDPDNLITVTHITHNAIHYGDPRQIPRQMVERRPGDTKMW